MNKLKDMSRTKKTILIVILLIMFSTSAYLIANTDKIITNTATLSYTDGCNETYINGKFNSSNRPDNEPCKPTAPIPDYAFLNFTSE